MLGSPLPFEPHKDNSTSLEEVCEERVINKNKTAIFLIDMQESYLEKRYDEFRKNQQWDQKVENQIELLEYAKKEDMPIYVFELFNNGETLDKLKKVLDGSNHSFYTKFATHGYTECHDKFDLSKNPKKIVKAEIEKRLRADGIDTIIIIGRDKYECVRRSIYASSEKGFNVIYSEDLVMGDNEDGQEVAVIKALVKPDFVQEFIREEIETNSRRYESVDSIIRCIQ